MNTYIELKDGLKKVYRRCESNQEKYIEGVWYLSNQVKELEEYQIELLLNYNYIMTNGGKE